MAFSIGDINPNYLLYAGVIGLFIGVLAFLYFIYRRIRWAIQRIAKRAAPSPKLMAGMTKLVAILFWTACFGMLLFLGAFLRAYHAFTYEQPVAVIRTERLPLNKPYPVGLVHFYATQSQTIRHFIVRGDQWMIEGDILKWKNWLNFLGLHTRYRLTRLGGRYMDTEAELSSPRSVHSLVEREDHPYWRYLYQYGQSLPFVSTVYGNASFQDIGSNKTYQVFVGTSGFIIREKILTRQ